jgi:hypothetical protein
MCNSLAVSPAAGFTPHNYIILHFVLASQSDGIRRERSSTPVPLRAIAIL